MVDATHHQEHKVLKTADTAEFDMRNLYPVFSLSLLFMLAWWSSQWMHTRGCLNHIT